MHGTAAQSTTNTTIESCLQCYRSCVSMAMNHCLEMGGKHSEPKHIRLMMACGEMCRTTAHLLVLGAGHTKDVCSECANICNVCAIECERLGGMEECVEACRECAKNCEIVS